MPGRLEIPNGWRDALEFLQESKGRTLLLGETDTGKSTLAAYLANELLRAGIRVSIVDADIGQSDIGPPTTVGLGEPKKPFESWREIVPVALYFVGSTSPLGHLLPLLVGTRKMVDAARGHVTLINTTGLVAGAGKALKTHKIEATEPDVILALQRKEELDEIIEAFSHIEIRRLEVPKAAKAKSPEHRRREREKRFAEYFKGSTLLSLKRSEMRMMRSYFGGPSRGQLCGLADTENRLLGLGIIERVSVGTITVKAPEKRFLSNGPVKIVQLSKTQI